MREAVRQGYFPGAGTPFGFTTKKTEIRPNVFRSMLVRDENEAATVRRLFQLYVAGNGAKSVAKSLNARGCFYRRGSPWSKDLVLHVLDEPAVAGTYFWGRWSAKRKKWRNEAEWLPLRVEAIVETSLYELALKLRRNREPTRNPGRPASKENVLAGLIRCGKCGASYQLETSGKRVNGDSYQYRYYNCRTFCRVGSGACSGGRIPTVELDAVVLEHIANLVCAPERCDALRIELSPASNVADLHRAWSSLITAGGTISRNYLLHLIERIEVRENEITIVPRAAFAAPREDQSKHAPLEAARLSPTTVGT